MMARSAGVLAFVTALSATGWAQNSVRGKILDKKDDFVQVRTESGQTVEFYIPKARKDDGSVGLDPRIAERVRELGAGDLVLIGWWHGEDRAYIRGIEKIDGEHGEDDVRIAEGRVLRTGTVEGRLILTVLVEGRRMELVVPGEKVEGRWVRDRGLEESVAPLLTGYLVAAGYVRREDARVLRWVRLIRGGAIDRSEEWAAQKEEEGLEERMGDPDEELPDAGEQDKPKHGRDRGEKGGGKR